MVLTNYCGMSRMYAGSWLGTKKVYIYFGIYIYFSYYQCESYVPCTVRHIISIYIAIEREVRIRKQIRKKIHFNFYTLQHARLNVFFLFLILRTHNNLINFICFDFENALVEISAHFICSYVLYISAFLHFFKETILDIYVFMSH